MQKKHIKWMEEAGWKYRFENSFGLKLDDRTLISYATFSDLPQYFIYYDDCRVNFPFQLSIVKKIEPRLGDIGMVDRGNTSFKTEQGSLGFIIECTDELIRWAKSLDPEAEIKKLADHEKVYEKYNHLAALAITGDFDRLRHYLEQRRNDPGDGPYIPGTLPPMIEVPEIERAIEIAEHYKKNPMDWSAPAGV